MTPGRPVGLHPAALEDATAAYRWYAARNPLAAVAFVAALERAIHEVVEHPGRWPAYVHGTRRYLLHRFPFMVVYRESGDGVEVLAVAHGRRRPGYWRAR